MGIKGLQEFLEQHCSSACVSVDLLKISRGFVPKRRGRYPGSGRFCLVVDAESCLDRLYGGFFSDWVCGGQWNRMLSFLTNLMQACQNANMDLVVFFNGCLESQKMDEWYAEQVNQKKKVNMVLRHLNNKGTPPPKVWWNAPVFLRGALRMALRHLGIGVACSMDDHPQEVIGFCREHGMQGILAQDSVYAIFDPPRYFSSHNLKLTYKGSLETKEYIMDEIAKCLDLNPNRFCIFAALLGNHILSEEELYDFFKDLANRAQEAGKSVKPTPENIIRAVVDYVRSLPEVGNLDMVGEGVFRNSKASNKTELISKFKQSVQYYLNGTQDGFLKYRPRPMPGSQRQGNYPASQNKGAENSGYADANSPQIDGVQDNKPPPLMGDNRGGNRISPDPSWNLKMQSNKKSNAKNVPDIQLPPVSPEIMRIASERHQKGLMTPWIYQLLSQGEVKMFVPLEDDSGRELPTSMDLYKPVRQTVYSVLLNLNKLKIINDTQSKEKGDASSHTSFEMPVKEWLVRRTGNNINTKPSFDIVIAKPVDWKTPSIERMWLGQQPDDKTRRLRAFLTCLHSDSPLMLNTQYVPQHLLILCCVLRYMLQFGRVLQRQELDAFLAMSVSPLLQDVQTMQDLKLPNVQPRGVHLASLFMAGIENALFANDVCGAPIPWTMCCPWQFFDGKLFHFKLLKANNNTPLIDMCDGQVDQVLRVERMRQAIMEGLRIEFARPMLPHSLYTSYPLPPYGGPPFEYGGGPDFRPAGMGQMHPGMRGMGGMGGGMGGMGGMGPGGRGYPGMGMGMRMGREGSQKNPGRGRGILGNFPAEGRNVDARGGQLEIAGVVVGSWGPNLSGAGRQQRGNSLTPRVMSVGGARRQMGRGMMYPGNMRQMRGRGYPMYGGGGMGRGFRSPMQERNYYYGRPRGYVTGVRRPAVRARPRPVSKGAGRGNKMSPAKGRGMTVETGGNSGSTVVVSVNQVLPKNGSIDKEVYEDAEEGNSAIGKIPNGLQSPDSGIHGDRSGTELNVIA